MRIEPFKLRSVLIVLNTSKLVGVNLSWLEGYLKFVTTDNVFFFDSVQFTLTHTDLFQAESRNT